MHTRLLLRTLIAAGVAAVLTLPLAATAQTRKHQDAAHDVQRFDVSTQKISNAPHNRSVDVVRTRVAYSKSLRSSIWLRSGTVPRSWSMEGKIHSPSGSFEWDATRDRSGHTLILMHANGGQVACNGLALHVKRAQGRVTITLPSRCLGRPAVLREGMLFAVQVTDTVAYYDDAFRTRGFNTHGVLALSHRVHRG